MQKARIQIWLFEQKDLRIEGRIIVSSELNKYKVDLFYGWRAVM